MSAPKKPGPKPGTPRKPHPEGCPCPVCNQGEGRRTRGLFVRLPNDLADWVAERGGPAFLRELAQSARAALPAEPAPAEHAPG